MRMERKLRAVVLLQIHLLCVSAFFADGQSSANHENVIDLVEALNIPHRKNVTSSMIYKLRPRAPHLTLPAEYSHFLYSNLQGSMGVHVVARQAPRSTGTVFSLSSASASLPILQIISSTLDNTLRLDYQAEGRPHSFASFHFPGTNPFSSETWVWLAVSLEPDRLAFFVDCQEAAVLPIESENKINLELPQDVLITLGSTLGKRDSKFSGYLKTAELSLKAYPRRPWICNNLTDEAAPSDTHNPDSWTESSHPHSKHQAKHRSQEQTSHHPPDIQSDQMQRAAVVEPRGSPQGVTSASQVERDDRLRKLERRMTELTHMLDRVNNKNEELQNRVSFLELCLKEQCQGTQSDYPVHNASNLVEDCFSPASSCNACLSQPCPSQPCPPQPCPPQPCPPQTYPIQHCKEENVPDCQPPACNPCPPQPCPQQPGPPQECPPQACPVQNCKEENVPDCQRRTCEGGNRECPTCSEENVPEGCEQQTTSCTHSGVSYNHGDSWRSVENPCDICSCSEGQVHCEREQCNTGCRNPAAPPPNSCCPVCDGCGVNGHDFPNGAVMPVGDPCQECTCVDGNMVCSPVRCPALSCHNPVHHAGECCPRCEQCQYESEVYMNGDIFTSRRDPCLQCHCSAGEVSCENMAASCPAPHCSHPAKHTDECCPTCTVCEYEQQIYVDGTVFTPAGSGPCLQCRCKGGNVLCNEEKCPPVHCSNPVRDPHQCCPVCKTCVLEGIEYEAGSNWQPEGPCSSCTCVNGEALCTRTQCPPTNCQHPTRITGSCCPVCDSCNYNNRIYDNGQRFTTPDQPCYTCTCLRGTVVCETQPCPPLNCRDSYTPPGECCPKCRDCSYDNRVFVNGEVFRNPVSACEECTCVSGRIDCHQAQCPEPRCNAPLPGTCCRNNCNGCSYAGNEYPNGQEFPHPTDLCRTCSCTNGNVQCLKKRCPTLTCSNALVTQRDCCPQCPAPLSGCAYEQRSYRHMERFDDPTHSCRSCICTNGKVHCKRKRCPFAHCSHPIIQDCCRTCEGCSHENLERANGETWDDRSDPCVECVCRDGSVQCRRKRCPASNCNHPVQRQCCMSCDGCMFNGREYLEGSEFSDGRDPCAVCQCYRGDVTCTKIPCNEECRHPYKPPGQCCGECERCSYSGVVIPNGQSIPDPGNPCSECVCERGSVQCRRKQCPETLCAHPVANACGCPVCNGCQLEGVTYADGQILPEQQQRCQDCRCSRGEVVCEQRRCPIVSCPHPTLNSCACEVCDGCNFYGRDCLSGEQFPHPTESCQRCSCQNGDVVCERESCPSITCSHPVTRPGDCCPACDSCLYGDTVYSNGDIFRPSSSHCQRCTCVRGTVECEPNDCQQTPCAQHVSHSGPCSECILNGQEFSDGQTWTLSSNHCSTCTCKAGEVYCAIPECPKLPCMHQVTDPGACCPRCRGCVYEGEKHAEGSSWFADSTPCLTCMCVDGVTTCSEVHCLSPCVNFIRVPGECCPVCADCVFEDRVYGPGDSFHPAHDPCQICTCEVMPDGEQHLKCYRKQCPSLVDCPKSNILFSGPDSCCPVCAQPLSNCTTALIGNEVLATDDPCFTCQCKDLTWTCLHKVCPPLTCPLNEQFTSPDSCCPVCKDCIIEDQNRHVLNGTSWKDSNDDCVTCTCIWGHIECSIEECLPDICLEGQKQVKLPGKCCYECQDSEVSCLYQGTVYHSNEHWEVDECTSCTCVSGDVHCHSERCPLLTCANDEMPAVVPGLCCPHCLPRPATCIAFGDPHYRTFDGRMLHFQGTCTYVLAQDCESGDFSIYATNDDRGRKGVSWTKEVTVFLGDVTVQLLQDWVVKVNDEVVTLPFLREPYIYIEQQTNTILLNTNIGLKVLWSPRSHVEVSVPGSYKGHTCGLCGNFNNYYQDDLRMPNGQISLSESDFGNSWRVRNGSNFQSSCHPGENVDPCKDAGFQAKKGANTRCKILKSAVFKPCHHVVPPEQWYGACVYDLCACGANTDDCLCDTLEAYASQCRAAGVILQWRSASLCAVGCPVERGFVFDECGPPCPVTCFNVDVPLGVIESHCFKPCVPGCQCPAGLVLHNNYCIPPEKCPKIIHGSPSNSPLTKQVDTHL
ncbi:kielin/chordin-like protein [Archocentrus centrarchus]|uniref:kielin/chordin-like protein n=1 Tax=Archocentrus centrarchus TaxID=63155 RepID=UPI0011E9C03A|nr:kielin/chordin-like protein [Archocentrus centrarchus]